MKKEKTERVRNWTHTDWRFDDWKQSSEEKGELVGYEPTLEEQYGSVRRATLTIRPLQHCEKKMWNNSHICAYRCKQKIFFLISRKMDLFLKN